MMNQSIQRAFAILQAVAASEKGIGVTSIAAEVKLHKSTVSRLLSTLEEVNAVERLAEGHGFRIGPEIVALAGQMPYPQHLMTLTRPFLLELAQVTGETSHLSLPEGDLTHYIDQVDSQYNLQIRDWTGYRLPMHATCDGKVFLAYSPSENQERYLHRSLQRFTPHTITDSAELREQLRGIREQGFAWTRGEYEEGIDGIAVPVKDDHGRVLASICVGGPSFRFPKEGEIAEVVRLLKEASDNITGHLSAITPTRGRLA